MIKNKKRGEDFDYACSRTWRGERIKDSSSKLSTAQRIDHLEAMMAILISEIQALKEQSGNGEIQR